MLTSSEVKRLNWEFDWIIKHSDKYRGRQHILEVIGNIEKRYVRVHLYGRIKSLKLKSPFLTRFLK